MRPRTPPFRAHHPFVLVAQFALALIVSLSAFISPQPARAAGVIYVTPGGTGDGSSWAQGLDLAVALVRAASDDELWVKAGTYKPVGYVDRTDSFLLRGNVAVYGGFAGNEITRDARNWATNLVVLSGDLKGDDASKGNSDNSYHVVYVDTYSTALLDGVTIQGGHAGGDYSYDDQASGGGMYSSSSSIRLTNVTFSGNSGVNGGAMYSVNSNPRLTNVTFSGNSAVNGGAMYNENSNPTLTNVTFSSHSALSSGGAMYNYYSDPTLTNVTFIFSIAVNGGGMYNVGSNPTLTNVAFSFNGTTNGGGMYNESSNPTLINVTFGYNSATNSGGGMYNASSIPTLKNSIIWGNTAPTGPAIANNPASVNVSFSLVQGSGGSGAGWNAAFGSDGGGNLDADPLLASDLYLQPGSPAINAGSNALLPADSADLDRDGNTTEPLSLDRGGTRRVTSGIVDMGTFEALGMAEVIYITPDGTGDGTSWAQGRNLVVALAAATRGTELWVKAGTYKPTSTTNRSISFMLKSGVAIYGGFAGNESTRNARNWTTNLVVLSGDLNGDDGANFANNAENSYNVVLSGNNDSTTRLDGVTIRGGNANGAFPPNILGGGMYNAVSSPTLTNVTFSNNSASIGGGGMYNAVSSPTLTNITFSNNRTDAAGGGVLNAYSSPILTNVTFSNNSASQSGGGMVNDSSSPMLTNVTFSANTTTIYGGGMFNSNNSRPRLTNVTFSANTATSGGGGMFNAVSSPTLTNVTFSNNSASILGGAMFNAGSSPILTNVTFSGNNATNLGGGMYNTTSSNPTLTNVIFSTNTAVYGGGMVNDGSSPILTNVTFSGNSASILGGGMFNGTSSSPTLKNSIIWGNTAPTGPAIANDSASVNVSFSLVQGSGGSGAGWNAAFGSDGGGNLDADPLLADDLYLQPGSPALNAGSNALLPADSADLDRDGNTTEPLALDRDGNPRVVTGATVDMGAFERPAFITFLPLVVR